MCLGEKARKKNYKNIPNSKHLYTQLSNFQSLILLFVNLQEFGAKMENKKKVFAFLFLWYNVYNALRIIQYRKILYYIRSL